MDKPKKSKKEEKQEKPEFPYIDEVPKEFLEGKHIFIDPGKKTLFSMMDDDGNYFSYTNKQRIKETKRIKYSSLLKNYKDKQHITAIENTLSLFNSKTCDIEKSLKKLPDEKDFILKCDIEGSEWDILESCNEEDLSKFRQIVIEFHHFIQSNNSDVLDKYLNVLKKINKTHQSINVHGNNCGPWSFKKMDLPNVLEITYLRKTDYEFKNFDKELTEKYNMPNCPKKPEMIFLKSEYLIK